MRFEIGPGGGFVILVGLLGLSAAVFFLGMISGREMAETEQSQTQLASVYPMPAGAPSAAAPQPVPAAPPQASAPDAAPAAAPAPPKPPPQTAAVAQPPNPAQPPRQGAPVQRRPMARPAVASAPRPRPAPSAEDESSSDTSESNASDSGEETTTATRPPPAAGSHRGYNIVIDAAMDRQAAYRMSSRLLALGYTSHIVPTEINGQTWYRVQVGPYPTSEDARAAQAQLRAAYTAHYVNRAGATGAASSATGESDSASSDSDSGSDDSGSDSAPSD